MPRRSAKRPKPPPIILCSRAVFSADPSVTKNLLYNKDNTSGGKNQDGNTEKSSDFFASILSALHRISFSREISAFDSRKRKNPWRRERDSNPCEIALKRFSRPPRYDRFDIPPYLTLILYHKLFFLSTPFCYFLLLPFFFPISVFFGLQRIYTRKTSVW